jgi:hypothetical protein
MKKIFLYLLFTTLCSVSSYVAAAALQIPQKDVGILLDKNGVFGKQLYKKLELSNNAVCQVALPDPKGNTPRVAKISERLAVWAEAQTPTSGPPAIYLGRRGDKKVTLIGPALDPVNMGVNEKVLKINDEIGSQRPMGIDKSNKVHWIGLAHIDEVGKGLKSFKDGVFDGDAFSKMSFKIKTFRPSKKVGQKTKRNERIFQVDLLIIKSIGRVRVYGVCLG